MQHTLLSAAQISALCGVDVCIVERWIEERRLFGALREYATSQDCWRTPHDHVERFLAESDQPSDPAALVVVFSPIRDSCQTTPEVRAHVYEVSLDTLHTLQCWLDLGGEPATASDDCPAFGDRLERLFALVTQPDGTPFTNETIAERAGLTDGTYVWKLRNKKWRAQDPKLSTVAALARAFGVSPLHFFVHNDVYALLAKERQSKGTEQEILDGKTDDLDR
jgi:transcriptional regulator with XRE-family HTH domain